MKTKNKMTNLRTGEVRYLWTYKGAELIENRAKKGGISAYEYIMTETTDPQNWIIEKVEWC